MNSVVKATIYIDMNDFQQINQIYGNYFVEHQPARSCVEVSRLPKDVKVEIELIGKVKDYNFLKSCQASNNIKIY